MKLLEGKKGLIMGVANKRSIAWGIAEKLHEHGAEVILSYQHEIFRKKLENLASEINCQHIFECDVSKDQSISKLMDYIKSSVGNIDFIVHSIAFANKNSLDGLYLQVPREEFLKAMDISCYSFTSLCREGLVVLNRGASLLTMSYLGAQRVVPNYNVMGVAKAALEASVRYLAYDFGPQGTRVNAISAGPVKTLAASGIGDFQSCLSLSETVSPLRRNVTTEEIGNMAMFLLSDWAKSITGGIHYVDSGFNTLGMTVEDVQINDGT